MNSLPPSPAFSHHLTEQNRFKADIGLTAELNVRGIDSVSEHVVVAVPEIDRIVATCGGDVLDVALVASLYVVCSNEGTPCSSIFASRRIPKKFASLSVIDLKSL